MLLMVQSGLVDVYRDDVGLGIREGVDRRLVGATARDENVEVGLVFLVGPQNPVGVRRVEPIPVHDSPRLEVLDGRWVGPLLVAMGLTAGLGIVLHVSGGSFAVDRLSCVAVC